MKWFSFPISNEMGLKLATYKKIDRRSKHEVKHRSHFGCPFGMLDLQKKLGHSVAKQRYLSSIFSSVE